MDKESLQNIDDVGVKVAESIHQYFSNPSNVELLKKLEAAKLEQASERLVGHRLEVSRDDN